MSATVVKSPRLPAKIFMRFGRTISSEQQSYNYLFAVGSSRANNRASQVKAELERRMKFAYQPGTNAGQPPCFGHNSIGKSVSDLFQ
jgi:hypothetical protein